ncbi:sulfite exporter TauE/SafE family protein [Phototrophicus methaneseepsis]|uniref:Probable membrane transporter protein n=1 Tax=Phototrophicus methaneseepsis TaxID=2710758 RepID=A0A7S8EC88_9CHLR|nr:sulfite exporter TauE/SafE family protein [Phototrophicus methaneseepsis]QPC84287.1 sulfite exporter TauE/SafE family protein [Phototrophicus methaneseepsis]
MEQLPILIAIGAVAGVLSGMFGIGGGAIIVPALMLFMGFTQTAANGTSLAALLLPVGVFGCIEYYRNGKLYIGPALMVAVGLLISTWFGASLALQLPEDVLRVGYALLLLFMAWRYIAPRKWYRELRGLAEEAVIENTAFDVRSRRVLLICLATGLAAGILSGLFGIGGGVVIVGALTIFVGFDQKLATGTSLGALLLPVGLPGVLRYAEAGDVDLGVAAPLAFMLLLGAFLGARLTLALPTKTVKRLYGFFLLAVGLRFLLVA